MTSWLLAAGLAVAVSIPLHRVSSLAAAAARDTALLGSLAVATGWLAVHEPIFAPLAAWFVIVWPRPHLLPRRHVARASHELVGPLLCWIGIGAGWFAVRALEPRHLAVLLAIWVAYAMLQGPIVTAQRWGWLPCARPIEAGGTFGQRTLCAAFVVLCAPFAPWWAWPGILWGLLVTSSWGAGLALGAGLSILSPRLLPWLALCAAGLAVVATGWPCPIPPLRRALNALPRGASLKPAIGRLALWRIMAREWRSAWPWGTGPDSMSLWTRRWQMAYQTRLPLGDAHCDPAQLAWEYGVAGLLTVALVAWRVGSGLGWGDPWSAAAVVGGVLCLGTFPLRVPQLGLAILVVWGRVAP